jgi:thioredoxin 1
MITNITKENFESFINDNEKVLIDFHASWCGPCRAMSPVIDEFAEKHADIAVGKCDVENNEEIAEMFGVLNLPFIAFLKNRELANSAVGLQTIEKLESLVK